MRPSAQPSTAAPRWQPYVDYGRQFGVWLTTISADSLDGDMQRLLDGSTGEFHEQFVKTGATYTDLIRKLHANTKVTAQSAARHMTARRTAWWLLVDALTVATAAVASAGAWQLLAKSRQPVAVADQPAAREAVIQAAITGTVNVLSYSADTFDQDVSAASAMLTGAFLEYYKQFTSQIVGPAAREKRMKTSPIIQDAGVESLTRDSAKVLVFVKQQTSSKDLPSPTESLSAVRMGMAKVNRAWLISKFDPV
jgi:Mce-associated membrane protein